jgi:hypothetical protein
MDEKDYNLQQLDALEETHLEPFRIIVLTRHLTLMEWPTEQ